MFLWQIVLRSRKKYQDTKPDFHKKIEHELTRETIEGINVQWLFLDLLFVFLDFLVYFGPVVDSF
jgi:hypothetical protein